MKKIKILSLILVTALVVAVVLATAISSSAATKVTEADFVPEGLSLTLGVDYDYSFAVVGDTQCLNLYSDVNNGTDHMNGLYSWIINNSETKNIKYVMGLGDITQTYTSSTDENSAYMKEWANAKAAVSLLSAAGIPFSLVRGNHDVPSGFNSTFGEGSEYYSMLSELVARGKAGIYEEGKIDNTWRKLEIGSDKYLIITFDWFPTEGAMYWAESIINANPDYKVIVTTHQFLAADGTIADDVETTFPYEQVQKAGWSEVGGGNVPPRVLWDEVLSKYENVEMILCGHVEKDDIISTQLLGDNGNTVTCMLINPQNIDEDAMPVGMVAMLYFKENGESVGVEYISTVRANDGDASTYEYLKSQNQFKLALEYKDGWIAAGGGYIPASAAAECTFHFLLDDDGVESTEKVYLGSYDHWHEALSAVGNIFNFGSYDAKYFKSATIYMSKEYDGTAMPTSGNAGAYSDIGKIPGAVELDMGGNTLTMKNSFFLRYYNQNAAYEPTVTVKNGSFYLTGTAPVVILQSSVSGANINLNFENVEFEYAQGATSKIISYYSNNSKYYATVDMSVTDCTFNTKAAGNSVTLFDLKDTYTTNAVTLNMKGGSVIGSTADSVKIFSANVSDKIYIGANDAGELLTLTLDEEVSLSDIYKAVDESSLKFGTAQASGTSYIYKLESTTDSDGSFESTATDPIHVFDQNGEFKKSYTVFDTAVSENSASHSVLVFKDNVTVNKRIGITKMSGSVVIDLGGNTLTVPEKYGTSNANGITNLYLNTTSDTASLQVTFKNGTIANNSVNPLFYFDHGDSSTNEVLRSFTFEDVTFEGLNSFFTLYDKSAAKGVKASFTFNNCTFNYGGSVMFNMRSSAKADTYYNHIFNVTINGGKFISSVPLTEGLLCKKDTVSGYADSLKFGKYNGEYTRFYIESSDAQGAAFTAAGNEKLSSLKLGTGTLTEGGTTYNIWSLGSNIATAYGDIKFIYSDKDAYPFVMFKINKSTGESDCIGAYGGWKAACEASISAAEEGYETVVLMRRSFTVDSSETAANKWYNMSGGSIKIDFGGFELTTTAKIAMQATAGSTNTVNVELCNGKLTLSHGLLGLRTEAAGAGETLNITLSELEVGFAENASVFTMISTNKASALDGGVYATVNLTINNCDFDLKTNVSKALTFLNLSGDLDNNLANVVINGGSFTLGDYALTLATKNSNYKDGAKDSVSFSCEMGKYTRFVLPCNASLPAIENFATVGGAPVVLTKWNGNTETTVYTIRESGLVDFVPKSSITLGSQLVYNVYVPYTSSLASFYLYGSSYTDLSKLSDKLVTLEDGYVYYRMEIEMPAAEAAGDVLLAATLNVGGKEHTGQWTMSIPRYAQRVAENANAEELQLVCDVLSYIKAAYLYFGTEDSAAIERIDNILNSTAYVEETPTLEGSSVAPDTGVTFVTYNLTAKPAIRFYVENSASEYTFYINGVLLEATVGTDEELGKYYEINLYAYQMAKTVTYSIDGELSGSYHLNAYLTWVRTQNNEKLITLAERFAKYCQSASEYNK